MATTQDQRATATKPLQKSESAKLTIGLQQVRPPNTGFLFQLALNDAFDRGFRTDRILLACSVGCPHGQRYDRGLK